MVDEEEKFEEQNSELDSEFVDEEESEQGPAAIKALREKLKKAVAEKQEYLDGWQRSRAEFANYKRQELGQDKVREERIKSDLVESLLPALDVFEMALKHTPTPELEIVRKQFLEALGRMGVEQFGKAGEAFDPYRHEALAQKGSGEKVESLERSGYSIGDKIIRPAHVII